MWKLIELSFLQSLCLVTSQLFLKLAMERIERFQFTWICFKQVVVNWQLACSGVTIAVATLLWVYILRHFDFSMAYPMISISYILGMLMAIFVFHETVPITRWIGVFLIMAGVVLVAHK